MRFIDNRGVTDAHVNLALEEYVLRQKLVDDDCLLFYVNAPSIIIGRNQNTIEEINADVVAARDIQIVRRISGGGAVYHDLGNLNFSFMTPLVGDRFNRYDHFTKPVIQVLRELGVPAELGGRNDILADGRKISGNAQFATHNRMFSHGTLLFDANLDDVTAALHPRPGKVEAKGVKSVRSRVANISEFLREPLTVDGLRLRILDALFGSHDLERVPMLALGDADWDAVHALVASKYGTWEWNYGEDPPYNVQRAHRFPIGEIDMRIQVQSGCIASIRMFGDYMGRADVRDIEQRFLGVRYERTALADACRTLDVRDYFGDITREELLTLMIG